jgi:hypothetical protein
VVLLSFGSTPLALAATCFFPVAVLCLRGDAVFELEDRGFETALPGNFCCFCAAPPDGLITAELGGVLTASFFMLPTEEGAVLVEPFPDTDEARLDGKVFKVLVEDAWLD